MSDIGAYSINDIRALQDLNPVEGGDGRYVQINRIPIEQIEEYYSRETEEPVPPVIKDDDEEN